MVVRLGTVLPNLDSSSLGTIVLLRSEMLRYNLDQRCSRTAAHYDSVAAAASVSTAPDASEPVFECRILCDPSSGEAWQGDGREPVCCSRRTQTWEMASFYICSSPSTPRVDISRRESRSCGGFSCLCFAITAVAVQMRKSDVP